MAPDSQSVARRVAVITIVFIALVVSLVAVRSAVLRGAKVVDLPPAAQLTGQISQTLIDPAQPSKIPLEGTDYRLTNTRYFNHNEWVVTTVVPISTHADNAIVVLKKQADLYQVVLGPGSAFSTNTVSGLPANVITYLSQTGTIYEPAD